MLQNIKKISKENSWKGLIFHIGFIAIVVMSLILIFFFVYLPSTTRHNETITVPNLEGMSLLDMDNFLKKRHLNYEVSDSNYFEKYPPLTILKQYPLSGSHVKERRKIYLTVNQNQPNSIKMPNLIDGSLKNAELVLKSYGLKRGGIRYKADLAPNAVLEQLYKGNPIAPGDPILKGSEVDLLVGDGLGRRVFSVPRFIGLPIDEADFSIKGSGLNTGSVIIKVINDEKMLELLELAKELQIDTASIVESGHVFQQRPEIGKNIRLGQQVDLWVVSLNEEDSLEVVESWMNTNNEELLLDESDGE